MLSNSGSSNHVKCFKSRDSRELCNTREFYSLWIRQRMMWPRKTGIIISKTAKPGWRDLSCIINWHQIFKTSLNDRNGDKSGFAARGCSLLIWLSTSCVNINSYTGIYSSIRLPCCIDYAQKGQLESKF